MYHRSGHGNRQKMIIRAVLYILAVYGNYGISQLGFGVPSAECIELQQVKSTCHDSCVVGIGNAFID
jgi:hypothetical protein